MFALLAKRILWAIPTLWIIATLTFFFLRLIPGGPFDQERQYPPEIQANIQAKYGLDQPMIVQYGRYLNGLIHGDPGPSLKYLGRSTRDIIAETLPISLQLGSLALFLSLIIGLPLGILGATRYRTAWDRTVIYLTSLGISLPNFVLAAVLVMIFSYKLKILPPALWEGPRYMLMPAFTLAVYPMAFIARLSRTALIETLQKDFILTARAKGLSERSVILKHALKNAMTGVVSVLGPLTAALITGSFIVEKIFAIPGMGQYFVTAVTNRDYPLVLGVTLVYAVFVIAMNFIVDWLYTVIDPRVRMEA